MAAHNLPDTQISQRHRISALARWSREDPKPTAERAQRGLRAKFAREVAAEFPGLAEAELARRADCRYREHMARLAYASTKARAARKGGAVA